MDALDRADETLARAQARRRNIVTPASATSPMDAHNTVRIPRTLVSRADPRNLDPESTVVIARASHGFLGAFGPSRQWR
ncbi:MAG TPA: hypothetical protein VE709_04245 [Pseudonocardiaceae bacterium]|nr:hypothetical protein [Pseudonocardiaceae bacterium]